MREIKELASLIGGNLQDKDNIKPQLGGRPDIYTYLRTRVETVEVVEVATIVEQRSIAGDTGIYGNADFGIYGTSKYGSGANTSFILGHSIAGVLGTSKLGSQASAYSIIRVINPNNTHVEMFNDDTFKDATTTADWATTPGTCSFTNGEIAVSEIIALNNETYTQALVNVTGTDTSNLTFYVRFDGSNWEAVTPSTTKISSYPSSAGIEWKAVASGTATLTQVEIIYA